MSIDTSNRLPSSARSAPAESSRRDGRLRPDPGRSTEPESGLVETSPLPSLTAGWEASAADATIRLQPDSAPDPSIPVSIDRVIAGRYCLECELGRGGFGIVMLAYDRELQRRVAIKVAKRTSGFSLDHLLEEGRKVALLDHPNIVPVYDSGRIDSRTIFIVSKYIDGGSLASQLALRRLSVDEVVTIAGQVAEALAHAHERGLIHRDLKPSNILLDSRKKAYVADFGLALRTTDRSDQICIEGSPQYMSPEQATGKSRMVDRRTDVFSFGVILYEMATGRRPFPGRSTAEYRDQVIHDDPPPPRQLAPEIPAGLEAICLKAMAKDPAERYASAWELNNALKPCRHVEIRQPIPWWASWVLLTVLLVIAAIVALGPPRFRPRLSPAPGPAAVAPPTVLPRPALVPATAVDHEVMRWVLARGGAIDFENFPPSVTVPGQLPEEPTAIRAVDLKGIKPVTREQVAMLCELPDLRFLHLTDTDITDDDLVQISQKDRLQMLWVGWNDLTDPALSLLGRLPELNHLDLERTELTNAGLKEIAEIRTLGFLSLAGTRITSQGLRPLRRLLELRVLNLARTPIGDEAIDDLIALRGLTRLDLQGTAVSPEGVERLRAALPECVILR